MSSTKQIKRRIKSSKNIAKITKAMEMVSASKMKKAQEQALSSRSYSEKMREITEFLTSVAKEDIKHPLLNDPREEWAEDKEFNILVILFSTDKSLCGGLNHNLFKGLEKWIKNIKDKYSLPENYKLNFITVGKKGKKYILKNNRFLSAEFPQLGDKPYFQDILPVSKLALDGFKSKKYQMVFTTYMKFVSTISQKLAIRQLLPIMYTQFKPTNDKSSETLSKEKYKRGYLFEPSVEIIFTDLLPKYIELQIYHILLESIASEHSARMVAMKNANENAIDIINELTLKYNKVRQTKITNELLDVISARMALQ